MDVFDIIGPIMIGPSSSHTAGAVRLGNMARLLLTEEPSSAHLLLHGSFARTYKGHGTDKALVAGILGMATDDERIRTSLAIAQNQGLAVIFEEGDIADAHPNTVLITLESHSGKKVQMQGSSVGGGNIVVTAIDGMEVKITGQSPTVVVVHKDTPGMIAAVTRCMAEIGLNVYKFNLARDKKGGTAIMSLQIDGTDITTGLKEHLESITHVERVILIKPYN